jgi:hypothetical protein
VALRLPRAKILGPLEGEFFGLRELAAADRHSGIMGDRHRRCQAHVEWVERQRNPSLSSESRDQATGPAKPSVLAGRNPNEVAVERWTECSGAAVGPVEAQWILQAARESLMLRYSDDDRPGE